MKLISPLWLAIRVHRQIPNQDGTGSLVNISSGAGHPAGSPTLVSYGAAKSGLNHLTGSLAEEWGPQVRVNCLAHGPTMTDNLRSFALPKDDPDGAEYFRNVPLRRPADDPLAASPGPGGGGALQRTWSSRGGAYCCGHSCVDLRRARAPVAQVLTLAWFVVCYLEFGPFVALHV